MGWYQPFSFGWAPCLAVLVDYFLRYRYPVTFARASSFLPGNINIHRNLSTSFLVAQLLPLETSSLVIRNQFGWQRFIPVEYGHIFGEEEKG